ncbi:hypothetical protein RhiJN_15005 [Ceratobasidium sp. AG-Ba]|nr:hypothetical protein RhiJN_15005 [Ceratobasidium sp. AG-Ba]
MDVRTLAIPVNDGFYKIRIVSDELQTPRLGLAFTLKSELEKVKNEMAEQKSDDQFFGWLEERVEAVRKRHQYGYSLKQYLNFIDFAHELELNELREERRHQINNHLKDEGWSDQDLCARPERVEEWHDLVWRPVPTTDQVWNELRPRLLPILEANRAYDDQIDRDKRRSAREHKLERLVTCVRLELPPLMTLSPKSFLPQSSSSRGTLSEHATPDRSEGLRGGPSVRVVDMPFPTMADILTWPMVVDLLDQELSLEEFKNEFKAMRKIFDQSVAAWRAGIEQELVDIWGHKTEMLGQINQNKLGGKGKSESTAPARRSARIIKKNTTATTPLALPQFTLTFTKADGTNTSDMSELSANLQLLLRAGTLFFTEDEPLAYYPVVISSAVTTSRGSRWDASKIKRNDEVSKTCRRMLAHIGRSDTLAAEAELWGSLFTCGRCSWMHADNWRGMVKHYCLEQSAYNEIRTQIDANPFLFMIVHNNLHDLEKKNDKPIVKISTREEVEAYNRKRSSPGTYKVKCVRCNQFGHFVAFFHVVDLGEENSMIRHLRDTHEIMNPVAGLHFKRVEEEDSYVNMFETDDS